MSETPLKPITKDAVFAAMKPRIVTVPVPELGIEWYICGLTMNAKDDFEKSLLENAGQDDQRVILDRLRSKLLQKTSVKGPNDYSLVFGETDIEKLGGLPAAIGDRLFDVAKKESGMDQAEVKRMLKNSAAGQTSASASGSASPQA